MANSYLYRLCYVGEIYMKIKCDVGICLDDDCQNSISCSVYRVRIDEDDSVCLLAG
jgi:hypothetical protein